mgnify:CR=1 FL=1
MIKDNRNKKNKYILYLVVINLLSFILPIFLNIFYYNDALIILSMILLCTGIIIQSPIIFEIYSLTVKINKKDEREQNGKSI